VKTAIALIALSIVGIVASGCGTDTPTAQNKASSSASSPAAVRAPDEPAAIDALRKINEAQSFYFKMNRRYALSYDELVEAHLLKTEPSSAQTGYEFKLRPAPDAQTYKLYVAPADSAAGASRHFFADQSGSIRAETGKDATPESPVTQ